MFLFPAAKTGMLINYVKFQEPWPVAAGSFVLELIYNKTF